jgi:hypothetical protein
MTAAEAGRALLIERLVEVVPIRVHAMDEADLPGAGPVLHGLFALDRVADVGEVLVPDEALEIVAFVKPSTSPSRCC